MYLIVLVWFILCTLSIAVQAVYLNTTKLYLGRPQYQPWTPYQRRIHAYHTTSYVKAATSTNNLLGHIDLHCDARIEICSGLRYAYQRAGRRLAALLDVQVPISIQVSYGSFCNGDVECEREYSSVLARAYPTVFWPLYLSDTGKSDQRSDEDPIYNYPQALVRQYVQGLGFYEYDIVAAHNSDRESTYWLRPDPNDPDINLNDEIYQWTSEKYDMEHLVLHELLHGLGLTSSWGNTLAEDQLTPTPWVIRSDTPEQIRIVGLHRQHIFDRYIYFKARNQWLYQLADPFYSAAIKLAEIQPDGYTREAYSQALNETGIGERARDVYQQVTIEHNVWFVADTLHTSPDIILQDTGSALELYAPSSFEYGSTLLHANPVHQRDFLIWPHIEAGQRLDDRRDGAADLLAGVFSPGLVTVLKTLGYTVRTQVHWDAEEDASDAQRLHVSLFSLLLLNVLFTLIITC
jgi:hypothetical protein